MTNNEHQISFMIVNDQCHLFSFATQEQAFLKQSGPANLGYHPILFHPTPFIRSQMTISLMLAWQSETLYLILPIAVPRKVFLKRKIDTPRRKHSPNNSFVLSH